jgi:hypothetical protein
LTPQRPKAVIRSAWANGSQRSVADAAQIDEHAVMGRALKIAAWFFVAAWLTWFVSMFGDCGGEISFQECEASKYASFWTIMAVLALICGAVLALHALRARSKRSDDH